MNLHTIDNKTYDSCVNLNNADCDSCDTIELTNDISQTKELGNWVAAMCNKYGSDPSLLFNIQLAVEEAVVNVMEYAYPNQTDCRIIVSVRKDDNERLTFTIVDWGIEFDPTKQKQPNFDIPDDEIEVGGLGIFLTNELTYKIVYHRYGDKNVLELTI